MAALTELNAYWIGDELDPKTGIEKIVPVTHDYVCRTHLMMLGTTFGYLDLFDFVPGWPSADVREVMDAAER